MGGDAQAIQGVIMTKTGLIKAFDGLPDDTRIYVSGVRFTDEVLSVAYVQIDDDGSDGGIAEVTILGVGKKPIATSPDIG